MPTANIQFMMFRAADAGMSALWVSHDPAQVRRIADRVLRIEHGRSLGMEPVTPDPDVGQVSR